MIRKLIALMLVLLLSAHACAEGDPVYTPVEPTRRIPDYVTKLLDVAIGELGYTEGYDGYTKYGEWSGSPTTQWCAEFLCWCVDQVDQLHGTNLLKNVYPLYSGQNVGRDWFIEQGRYVTRSGFLEDWGYQWYPNQKGYLSNGSYIPQPGDWVFFTWTDDSDTDHVAMVEYTSVDADGNYYIHVIEGNNKVSVARNIYPLTDDEILGYGTVHETIVTTMRAGNEGKNVLALQQKLVELGYLAAEYATGRFGPSTTAAVNAFQADYGLDVIGRANRQTQDMLDEVYSDFIGWLVIDEPEDE